MPQLSITKIFRYEAAHALMGYDGLCANIHGHSYRLEVTVCRTDLDATPGTAIGAENKADPKCGMLMDFSDLKQLVNETIVNPFDHALILNASMQADLLDSLRASHQKIITLPFQPTSENMILYFASRLTSCLPAPFRLKKLRLYETESSFTDWENDAI